MGSVTLKRPRRGRAGGKGEPPRKGGTGGKRVSYPWVFVFPAIAGIKDRDHKAHPKAVRVHQLLIDGSWRTLANVDLPRLRDDKRKTIGPVRTGLCSRCNAVYSHLMRNPKEICEECHGEEVAKREAWLAAQLGVGMGYAGQDQERARELAEYRDRPLGDRWDRDPYRE